MEIMTINTLKELNETERMLAMDEMRKSEKSVGWTYIMWAFAGLFGFHLFYTRRYLHGILALLTCNFATIGFWIDIVATAYYVKKCNMDNEASIANRYLQMHNLSK